eukprot:752522-Hanusia_phi.AAC.3
MKYDTTSRELMMSALMSTTLTPSSSTTPSRGRPICRLPFDSTSSLRQDHRPPQTQGQRDRAEPHPAGPPIPSPPLAPLSSLLTPLSRYSLPLLSPASLSRFSLLLLSKACCRACVSSLSTFCPTMGVDRRCETSGGTCRLTQSTGGQQEEKRGRRAEDSGTNSNALELLRYHFMNLRSFLDEVKSQRERRAKREREAGGEVGGGAEASGSHQISSSSTVPTLSCWTRTAVTVTEIDGRRRSELMWRADRYNYISEDVDKTGENEESKGSLLSEEDFSEPYDQLGNYEGAQEHQSSANLRQATREELQSESLKLVIHPSIVPDLKVVQLKEVLREYK